MKKTLFRILNFFPNFLGKIGINKRTPGALKLYNFLYKSFWPYKNIEEVQGSKMYVNPKGASVSLRVALENYANNKIHEKTTTELFKKTIKEGDIIADLGANVGYFTLLAAKLTGEKGRVFSFEPEPHNYNYLKKNIEINNYNHASAFQKAVSDRNGRTKLYICDYDPGHHTINSYSGIDAYSRGRKTEEKKIDIDTITLDSFLEGKTNKVDVIKMDVEGAEMLALSGMDKILKSNKNIKMFIEFFPLLIENMGSSPKEFIHRLLKNYNFSIFVIPDDYNAKGGEMIRAADVDEIMELCQGKEDHINLFLKRE